jgi:hypothetical protein
VAEFVNHRATRWFEGGREGTIIVGGNGQWIKWNQLNSPVGLSFVRHGSLYVSDCRNHRIQNIWNWFKLKTIRRIK